jgi:hypothetical protein
LSDANCALSCWADTPFCFKVLASIAGAPRTVAKGAMRDKRRVLVMGDITIVVGGGSKVIMKEHRAL